MASHPIIALAGDRDTKQSKGFRAVAARLTGEELAGFWQQEIESALASDLRISADGLRRHRSIWLRYGFEIPAASASLRNDIALRSRC